jgi:hypothetical protein
VKAISLWQPWATLVALGEKRYETRGWGTPYRGELVIHATKGFPREARELCEQEPFQSVLAQHGIFYPAKELPRGAIVAVANLVSITKTDEWWRPVVPLREFRAPRDGMTFPCLWEPAFGDYSDGRFAWELADIRPLVEPLPWKGNRKIWNGPAIPEESLKEAV